MENVIKKLVLINVLFFLSIDLNAQEKSEYLIFQFKEINKIKVHPNKSYFWIISSDSILNDNLSLSYLFIKNISKNNISDCIRGIPFDPQIIDNNTEFYLDLFQKEQISKFEKLFLRKRKRIKSLKENNKKIRIYFTSLKGDFCFSKFHEIGIERTNFNGNVSIPLNNLAYSKILSKNFKKKIVTKDFSNFKYDIIY